MESESDRCCFSSNACIAALNYLTGTGGKDILRSLAATLWLNLQVREVITREAFLPSIGLCRCGLRIAILLQTSDYIIND